MAATIENLRRSFSRNPIGELPSVILFEKERSYKRLIIVVGVLGLSVGCYVGYKFYEWTASRKPNDNKQTNSSFDRGEKIIITESKDNEIPANSNSSETYEDFLNVTGSENEIYNKIKSTFPKMSNKRIVQYMMYLKKQKT